MAAKPSRGSRYGGAGSLAETLLGEKHRWGAHTNALTTRPPPMLKSSFQSSLCSILGLLGNGSSCSALRCAHKRRFPNFLLLRASMAVSPLIAIATGLSVEGIWTFTGGRGCRRPLVLGSQMWCQVRALPGSSQQVRLSQESPSVACPLSTRGSLCVGIVGRNKFVVHLLCAEFLLCAELLLYVEKNRAEHLRKGHRIPEMLICLGGGWGRLGKSTGKWR